MSSTNYYWTLVFIINILCAMSHIKMVLLKESIALCMRVVLLFLLVLIYLPPSGAMPLMLLYICTTDPLLLLFLLDLLPLSYGMDTSHLCLTCTSLAVLPMFMCRQTSTKLSSLYSTKSRNQGPRPVGECTRFSKKQQHT